MEPWMEAELPVEIAKEESRVQDAWRMGEVVAASPFRRLREWLDHRGIDVIPGRVVKRNTIYKRLLKRNLWRAWQNTKSRVQDEWWGWPENGKEIHPRIFFSRRCKEELLWRLCESLMVNVSQEVVEKRRELEPVENAKNEEGMEFLPPWMRWVANHPFLTVDEGDVNKDEKLKAICDDYQSRCPNQAAKNWLVTIRRDSKHLADFWKLVSAKYSEEVKRTDRKPDAEVDEEAAEHLEHVASLAEMLGV